MAEGRAEPGRGNGGDREAALRAEVERALRERRGEDLVNALVALTEEVPGSLFYHARLAAVLEGMDRIDEAIAHYQRLLQQRPDLADAHYNLGILYRRNGQYHEALSAYQRALDLGIDNPKEVYLNLGVLSSEMRRTGDARQMFERAIALDARYVPALFNLAGLFEETGDRDRATDIYGRILEIDPRHWESLARLAGLKRITEADRPLVASIARGAGEATDQPLAREALYFALGKAHDDLGEYEAAFAAYRMGNAMGRTRNPPYDRRVMEQLVDDLVRVFDGDWLARMETGLAASPVFICGMFRSGSTLVEQILGAHRAVSAGGELEILPRLIKRNFLPYPARAASASRQEVEGLGRAYAERLEQLFPGGGNVTDKMPDNFLHLGLIAAALPRARIVYTKRAPVDNCLSIWFQQLGGNLYYATDLEDTAHYYLQHRRLMDHWLPLLGDRIFTVDYDALVSSPRTVVEGLIGFLGLEWDEQCLAFEKADTPAKTASVWQVREPLHTRSSGRWKHYEPYIGNLLAALDGAGAPKP